MISLASSAETFSLITEGALSTNPLASTNPKPVISLTALITATLVPPTSVNVTLTSVGSAAAPSSAAAATANHRSCSRSGCAGQGQVSLQQGLALQH